MGAPAWDEDYLLLSVTNAGAVDRFTMGYGAAAALGTLNSPNGTMDWDTWMLVGMTWGSSGGHLYKNGLEVASHAAPTSMTAHPGYLRIGLNADVNFSPVHLAFFGFWSEQLGVGAHQAIQDWRGIHV